MHSCVAAGAVVAGPWHGLALRGRVAGSPSAHTCSSRVWGRLFHIGKCSYRGKLEARPLQRVPRIQVKSALTYIAVASTIAGAARARRARTQGWVRAVSVVANSLAVIALARRRVAGHPSARICSSRAWDSCLPVVPPTWSCATCQLRLSPLTQALCSNFEHTWTFKQ